MSDVRRDEVNVVDYRVKSPLRFPASNIRDNRQSFPRRVPHALFHYACTYTHTHTHISYEFLFSSPSDDGKAVQGDLWKVAGVNYKVNRDHTIKEFKFVMDIDCWILLQPGFNISPVPVYYFSFFFFGINRFIVVIFVKNFSKHRK